MFKCNRYLLIFLLDLFAFLYEIEIFDKNANIAPTHSSVHGF